MHDAHLPWEIRIDTGSLAVRTSSLDRLEVFYRPSDERLRELGPGSPRDLPEEVKLLEVDPVGGSMTMFPRNLVPRAQFLQPKYTQIADITVQGNITGGGWHLSSPPTEDDILDLLDDLPSCFVKDYNNGLGFTQKHRHIVNAIEELSDCGSVVIGSGISTFADDEHKAFYLSIDDLDYTRRSINRVVTTSRIAAQEVNRVTVRNFLAERLGQPEVPVTFGRSPLRKALTSRFLQGDRFLPADEQELLLDVLRANVPQLAAEQPKRVALVQQELELANLDQVIDVYEAMMKAKCVEEEWQQFFSDNPFALHLSFGYPVIKIRDKAVVGGRDFSGRSGSITDFLVKNRMTHNAALVEIKTPQEHLVSPEVYRQGIYAPHRDLVGAVNQVLDQKVKFERSFAGSRGEEPELELEAYGVGCVVIAGNTPADRAKVKSFELFRRNSKNVDIITFDELLAKLKELREFLGVRAETE